MRRTITCCLLVLGLVAGGLANALAEGGTPAPVLPSLGTAVPVVGPDGTELGRLTVAKLVDPFETYDPSAPPQHGNHYVLLTVTARNTGSRPFNFDPGKLLLQDTEGFLYGSTTVHFGAQATPSALAQQDLAAGAEQQSIVGFQVLTGVRLARVFYLAANDQIVLLATLNGRTDPAAGSAISLIGPDGAEVGKITVTRVVNPFQAYEPSAPPARGQHFVLLSVSVQNTGPRSLAFDPGTLYLQDADGFLYGSTTIQRSQQAETAAPKLERKELAPHEKVSGVVGFQVLNGVAMARLLYQPASDQLVVLAAIGSSVAGTPGASPVAVEGMTSN